MKRESKREMPETSGWVMYKDPWLFWGGQEEGDLKTRARRAYTRLETAAAAAGDSDSWDADRFSVEDPVRKVGGGSTAGRDRWEGDDEDVKDNWDDDDDEKKAAAEVKPEVKISERKKTAEKIKEKGRQQKKRQKEIKKRLEEPEEPKVLTPDR
ncbi:hypothetical protein EI555_015221 [Monodon monoceros]|uniref:Uncharacterized protein n=1 Tax=Monodon monoceros TaxID=40151 RepID=A0A4U1EGT2_MONMO|nr:hypothetical protein EI555_015221 [Monodon monoceros]